jgi:hypothetical protein
MSDTQASQLRIRANEQLLDALRETWAACPEQRFGQLLMNLSRTPGGFADTWEWKHGEWYARMIEAAETWALVSS